MGVLVLVLPEAEDLLQLGFCSFPPLKPSMGERPHAVPTEVPTPGARPQAEQEQWCLEVSVVRQKPACVRRCVVTCEMSQVLLGGQGRLWSPWPLPDVSCPQLGSGGGAGEEALKRVSQLQGLLEGSLCWLVSACRHVGTCEYHCAYMLHVAYVHHVNILNVYLCGPLCTRASVCANMYLYLHVSFH